MGGSAGVGGVMDQEIKDDQQKPKEAQWYAGYPSYGEAWSVVKATKKSVLGGRK